MICPSSSPTHHLSVPTDISIIHSDTSCVSVQTDISIIHSDTYFSVYTDMCIIQSDRSCLSVHTDISIIHSDTSALSNLHTHYPFRHVICQSKLVSNISIIHSDTSCVSVHTDVSIIHCSNPHSFAKLMTGVTLWKMHSLALGGHPASGHSADHRPPSCAAVHRAH